MEITSESVGYKLTLNADSMQCRQCMLGFLILDLFHEDSMIAYAIKNVRTNVCCVYLF